MTGQEINEAYDEPVGSAARVGFDRLGKLLFAAAAFQTLRASCETGLLDVLGESEDGAERAELSTRLGVNGRWLDILLTGARTLDLISRSQGGRYHLPLEIAATVRHPEWPLFKAAVAFEQYITYPGIHDFTESLMRQTNVGLRYFAGDPDLTLYERLSSNPELRDIFYDFMSSWSRIGTPVLLNAVRHANPTHLLDLGGGDGVNAITVVEKTFGVCATVLELPDTAAITRSRIDGLGLADRIQVVSGDMFANPFPSGHDLILFAHQLVIWSEEENLILLRKANRALPIGGAVVIFSSMTNDNEDGPLIAAMASVYHACIPVEGGRIYSWRQYEEWLALCGFGDARRIASRGWTPHGAIVAWKVADVASAAD